MNYAPDLNSDSHKSPKASHHSHHGSAFQSWNPLLSQLQGKIQLQN